METTPTILVIGGPNGAGKTTLTPALLRRSPDISVFLNTDSIARALTGRANNNAAYLAGRIMLERMEALTAQKISFGLESTLSGKTLAASLQRYQRQGYRVEIVYITLESQELSQYRVAQRAHLGGHSIPLADIQRRFLKSHRNFWTSYRRFADLWKLYDNSASELPYQQLAFGSKAESVTITKNSASDLFLQKVGDS